MSSFTDTLIVEAVPTRQTGWRRLLPPGLIRPRWKLWLGFSYAVGSLENPSEVITVPATFCFDGASVPLPFRFLVPMAHPNYIQAAALHDWMLNSRRYSRRYCDRVFYEALGVLGMPDLWRLTLYAAVRIGSFMRYLRQCAMQAWGIRERGIK